MPVATSPKIVDAATTPVIPEKVNVTPHRADDITFKHGVVVHLTSSR